MDGRAKQITWARDAIFFCARVHEKNSARADDARDQ